MNNNQIQVGVLDRANIKGIVVPLVSILIITFAPFVVHSQWIVGPLVNALLIVILLTSGLRSAIIASFIPSLMALLGGLLPIVLLPVVPFIMVANVIFILTINQLNKKGGKTGYWNGVVVGAVLKFSFLYLSVGLIMSLVAKKELAQIVVSMMSWPQFVTAVLGGILAFYALKLLGVKGRSEA
jgi:hypothetical protein